MSGDAFEQQIGGGKPAQSPTLEAVFMLLGQIDQKVTDLLEDKKEQQAVSAGHEDRIRCLETFKARLVGGTKLLGAGGALLGALLALDRLGVLP